MKKSISKRIALVVACSLPTFIASGCASAPNSEATAPVPAVTPNITNEQKRKALQKMIENPNTPPEEKARFRQQIEQLR